MLYIYSPEKGKKKLLPKFSLLERNLLEIKYIYIYFLGFSFHVINGWNYSYRARNSSLMSPIKSPVSLHCPLNNSIPMASQSLQHRFLNDQDPTVDREPKRTNAKRASRSQLAVAVPVSLTMTIILLFGSGRKYHALAKPFWFPPLWLIHQASLWSSSLMGFAAWLVWADGGLHLQTDALPLYAAQIALNIVWSPLVLVIGARSLGFLFCAVNVGTLLACSYHFGRVNPSAKVLVKACAAWEAYLAVVTFKLIFL